MNNTFESESLVALSIHNTKFISGGIIIDRGKNYLVLNTSGPAVVRHNVPYTASTKHSAYKRAEEIDRIDYSKK